MPVKLGEPFGISKDLVDSFDWEMAVSRITNDTQSDFIFAPHLRIIYRYNAEGIIEKLKNNLTSGRYSPGSPITIEVPKSSRVMIRSSPPRPGPNYSRPGSILMPEDRLFYQFMADNCANIVDLKTNKDKSFSHLFNREEPEKLFIQTRECWSAFQAAMKTYSEEKNIKYILKIDIANFFGSINQHILVNNLSDSGLSRNLSERLEVLLTSFTNSRSSRGIIQGIFPSDMLGNFYLEPVDRFFSDNGYTSARYVDDIYIFIESVSSADELMKLIIPRLRNLDLVLNEAKSNLFPKSNLMVEEPDLEDLFQEAIEEVRDQLGDKDFEVSYGFQTDWDGDDDVQDNDDDDDDDDDDVDIELQATTKLFDAIENFRGHEEEIERFCLPLFIKANSDHAVEHVISSFDKRPSMCQIYCSYLGRFTEEERVHSFLSSLIGNPQLYDWQMMWVIGALIQKRQYGDDIVKQVYKVFEDRNRHDAVRAIAAIFVGARGDLVRRQALVSECQNVSEYVQSAIYFVSRRWRDAAKANMHAQWGARSEINKLIFVAWENAAKKQKS